MGSVKDCIQPIIAVFHQIIGIIIEFTGFLKPEVMKNLLFCLGICIAFCGCARNAVTGRNQLTLIPESELQSMADNEYKSFLTKNKNKVVSSSVSKDAEMVRRVGQRITK